MIYCFDKSLPFSYSKAEMMIGKRENNSILYNSETKNFEDFDGNMISIKDKIIFVRTGANQIYEINEQVLKNGATPIVSTEQIQMILNWSNYYETERKTRIIKGEDLIKLDKIKEIEEEYGHTIFIKTKLKNFSDNISTELLKDEECVFYKALQYHLQDDFIISEIVEPVEDEYGIKEYRCFVVNNEIYNISRYTSDILHKIDFNILIMAKRVIKQMKEIFPSCYSFDLFEYVKDGKTIIDVVEFNPIHAAGPYLYNTIFKKSGDILHDDINTISEEFLSNINELKIEGRLINRRANLYYPNTFAGDLQSIYLIGTRGLVHVRNFELPSNAYSKKVSSLGDIKFTNGISSDSELKSADMLKNDSLPQDILQKKLREMIPKKPK